MAQSIFMFDEPRASKSVPNCKMHSKGWVENLSGRKLKKPKSLPDRFRQTGRRGEVRFQFDDPSASKNTKK